LPRNWTLPRTATFKGTPSIQWMCPIERNLKRKQATPARAPARLAGARRGPSFGGRSGAGGLPHDVIQQVGHPFARLLHGPHQLLVAKAVHQHLVEID